MEYVIEDAKTVNQQVYEQLRDHIVSGRLRPGQRLVELRLANDIGISRAPVREALRRLEQEGLIVNRPRHGPYVRDITGADVRDLYQLRAALEGLAVQLLIERDPPGAGDELDAIIAAMVAAGQAGDLARFTEQELRFHQALCEHSGNSLLPQIYRSISALVQMVVALEEEPRRDLAEIADRHRPIVAAIRARDVAAATGYLRKHILNALPALVARADAAATAADGRDAGP